MRRNTSAFLIVALVVAVSLGATGCNKLKARDHLNKGVAAYKNAQFERAIEHFKTAKELDPELINARLYLATAYAAQYIPGAPSEENIRMGQQAVAEFQQVLEVDPNNLSAIDGIGSILFNMGGTPFDREKFEQSKEFHMRHIRLRPEDPEPYYWIGVINWTLAYRGNKEVRADWNQRNPRRAVKDEEQLPPAARAEFIEKTGEMVDEGIRLLKTALEIDPNYENAMAYLNLLYRERADLQCDDAAARAADLQTADEWVDKTMATKRIKAEKAAQQAGAGIHLEN